MASKRAKKSETTKKQVSFREHGKIEREKAKQPRRLKATAKKASRPARGLKKVLLAIVRPFGFLAWPFKLKPVQVVLRFLGKILFINYAIASFNEVKQVIWPSRSETIKLTTAVIMFAAVFALIVSSADWVIDKVLREIII
ncbi:MAG: preprotein translocase subunit SecE [bacterium]|nr:preprotein translocase subunit SecE [bacterium]